MFDKVGDAVQDGVDAVDDSAEAATSIFDSSDD